MLVAVGVGCWMLPCAVGVCAVRPSVVRPSRHFSTLLKKIAEVADRKRENIMS